MYIIDEVRVDKSGRINIGMLFDEMPKKVLVLYDTEKKALFFRGDPEDEWATAQRGVDGKHRVTLPKWMRDRLGTEFYVTDSSKKEHFLLVEKFFDQFIPQ
ncbi:hypothetical protein IKE80_02085 [Candidatus Saccharibacteria bacterium]|nr:hypothetical protein [Candidatus Saccharibacteria bacterium]